MTTTSGSSCSDVATQALSEEEMDDCDLSISGSQEDLPIYWGRLYPATPSVRLHDLTQNVISVGKMRACDICLQAEEVDPAVWAVISRLHFTIVRVTVEDFSGIRYKVKLKDLSMNGTYVDGELVGKDNECPLKDNSVIAFGRPLYEAYYYKDAWAYSRFSRNVLTKYDISIRLGVGAFGEVHLVFNKETGRSLAMKTILKGSKINDRKINSELMKLENEVKILRRIKHPNVIQLVDDIDGDTQKYLFLELMAGKDLFHRIKISKRLSERIAKLYFYQMASGVQYLHENGIIHRDIKPENILLASHDEETLLKITDFGLSKVLHSETYLMSLCGTKLYAAPEVLESGGCKKYTSQVDIWSLGAVLYVCLSGRTPFGEKKGKTVDEQIKEGDYTMHNREWEGVSERAKHLIKKMMTVNPSLRISISDLLKHQWLQDPVMLSKVEAILEPLTDETIHESDDEGLEGPSSPCPPLVLIPHEDPEMLPEVESNEKPISDESEVDVEELEKISTVVELLSPVRKRTRVV